MTVNQMRDGLFLGLAIDGIKKIPNDSIDIIITEPPESPLEDINNNNLVLDAKLIVAFTESGSTAARVAAYRPSQPVVAISPDSNAAINLGLRWGVNTINVESFDHIEDMFTFSENFVLEEKLASIGDTIVVVAGLPIGFKGNTNLIRVITIN